jgi:branched-chain amino acid aminotransferase
MSSIVYWNGRLVAAEEVRLAPDDAGLLHGDGLFETLRVDAGRARDVAAHLDRLLAGLVRLEVALPEDREALAAAVARVAAEAPRPTARLRLTVTRGVIGGSGVRADDEPTRLIQAWPYQPPDPEAYRSGVAALLLSGPWLPARGPLTGLKSLSYGACRLAARRAEAAGCWDALLANEAGRLAGGARSNLALALDGEIVTPPLADGSLPGTVRRRLLEAGALAERSLGPDDLARAARLFLLNSLVGVLPVGRVVGEAEADAAAPRRTFGGGAEGERLRRAWEEALAALRASRASTGS